MTRRRRTIAIILTSTAAFTVGLNRFIYRHDPDEISQIQRIETKLNLNNNLLKNNNENPYISIESTDALVKARYHHALQYVKQTHSINTHIRERGLSHLAKLTGLPSIFYSLLGQQLDIHSTIQLARTYEANSNYFPSGPPYIFTVGKQKILATDNIAKVNDDDVLLHTIRCFLDKLVDEKRRPLDILSQHYLKLVRKKHSH